MSISSTPERNDVWTRTECPVPAEEPCCPVTIFRLVQTEPGIREVRYDTAAHEMEIDYDPQTISDARARTIAEELARRIGVQTAGKETPCTLRECGRRALLNTRGIEFHGDVLRVPREGNAERRSPWVTRRVKVDRPGVAPEPPRLLAALQRRVRAVPVEPLFVLITLVALVAGAVAERIAPWALSWVFYSAAYLFGGYFGVQAGFASLRARKIDIDLLMVLAAIGAAAVGAPFEGALLLFLFSLSNVLQDYALDRTRSAIKALSKLRPDRAIVLDSPGSEHGREVAVNDIPVGAYLQVRPGDRIALDGVVESGGSSVDQSSITGESMPVEKGPGQEVLAGSINQDGELVLRVTKTSNESTIAKVITLVEEAQEQQARTERFLERFEQYYAAGVILATILAAVVPPYLFGTEPSVAVYRAITLMVAASPCALIISTPASILSAIGNGARRGILFKGGVHVEQAAGIQAIAFDKTGTLTEGKPRVAEIVSLADETEEELLGAAASLESKSQHVLAAAITAEARRRQVAYAAPLDFRNESGVGIRGTVDGSAFRIGSPAILRDLPEDDRERLEAEREIDRLQREGMTVVVLMRDHTNGTAPPEDGFTVRGLIALEDRLRPGVREVIQDLREAGIRHVVMLTGDNAAAAEQIAAKAGIDMVFPELLPENKLDAIRRIEEEYGPTAMVGDGINDAPALAGARLGIAMGAAGTDVALETADIVLLSDDLGKLPYLVGLSRRTRRTLVVNIAVAMSLIAMMVVGIYTIDLPLPLAVIGHEGGTVLVSLNGVRLLMFRHKRGKRAGG